MLAHLFNLLCGCRPTGSSARRRASLSFDSLSGWLDPGWNPSNPAAPARALLRCEQLEVRICPATSTWTGMGGNSLASNAANWDVAPVAGDALSFQGPNPAPCVIDPAFVANVADITVGAGYPGTIMVARNLTATGSVTVPNGTFTVNPGSTLTAQNVSFTGIGLLDGSGVLRVQGSMSLTGTTVLGT